MPQNIFELTRNFNASPAQLFLAWTQPAILKKWWCTPGYRLKTIEINLQPAGSYYYELVPKEGVTGPTCIMEGTFGDISQPEKLSYHWSIRAADFVSTGSSVEITFKPNGQQTALTVRHSGFDSQASYELHALDWPIVLSQLEGLFSTQAAAEANLTV